MRKTHNEWQQPDFDHIVRDLGNPSTLRDIWLLAAQAAAISELANANRNEIVAGALNVSNLKDYGAMVQQGGYSAALVDPMDYVTHCLANLFESGEGSC